MVALMMDVMLARLGGVMAGMGAMAAGGVGVMGRRLMIVLFVMPGGFTVMTGGFFVTLGGAVMMVAGGVLVRHGFLPLIMAGPERSRRRH
jgi:hypothetical protein